MIDRRLAFVEEDVSCLDPKDPCTANDLNFTKVNVISIDGEGPDDDGVFSCIRGEEITVIIGTIELKTRNQRYDLGVLFNQVNESGQSGKDNCTSIVFNSDVGELVELDTDDACGDSDINNDFIDVTNTPDIAEATIICDTFVPEGLPPLDESKVFVPYCATWQQNDKSDCDGTVEEPIKPIAKVGTGAKCTCQSVEFNIRIPATAAPSTSPSESPSSSPSVTPSAMPTQCLLPECNITDLMFPCEADRPTQYTMLSEFTLGIPVNSCNPTFTYEEILTKPGAGCPANDTVFTRIYTITDDVENQRECIQTITIANDFDPTFEANFPPVPDELNCSSIGEFPGPPVVTDKCGEVVPILETDCCFRIDGPDKLFLDRKWFATDSCGNTASETQPNPVDLSCGI